MVVIEIPELLNLLFLKKKSVMNHFAFIDFNLLSEEAKKELQFFYEYLVYKYGLSNEKKPDQDKDQKKFEAISLNTIGFKFNREEANER